ncbi:DUF1289 domain-containing protein [Pseudoalteromonas fenneropenaei]|uniref:DUF1289 domain-containing protein n=1 Tax=Pseudoalteromonas fenneropenaei TaxID=1737459 RepID=A0ABV7CHW1_9GAMM
MHKLTEGSVAASHAQSTPSKQTNQSAPAVVIESPCIRHCCLNNDDICVGCGRSLQEILAWHEIDDEAKYLILKRAEGRLRTTR